MAIQNQLFNQKTVQRLCDNVKISAKQKQAAKEWIDLLDENKLEDEKSNYPKFMQIILQDILGYPIKEIDFETNNVEFQFSNSEGKKILCFEAKGTSTKDLFAPQHRAKKEHETPIKQTWDYMGSIGLDYGICTNYKDFILITKQHGYSKYHSFNFTSIKKNLERLKEFVGIFSKERIIENGFVEKLHKESVVEEREFTKEFYKLYHETRLMMVKAFQEKDGVSKNESIYYTQLLLNRLIFIFFVEDRGFIPDKQLFTTRILHSIESGQFTEHSRQIYNDIKELFVAFDKGSRVLGVFGFNGSLFSGIIPEKVYFSDIREESFFKDVKQYSQLSKTTKLNDHALKIIKKYPDLNPIISNLLLMDSFDFNTEVNVNILGHIFEQSISDLEELKQEGVSRRKKDGVYYTPEYITDYICRNTIIPYLSKSGKTSVPELLEEYHDNLDELENKFKEIKILDPSCGSGAFLVKAIDVLLEIHKEIQNFKDVKKFTGDQLEITREWDESREVRAIIENNIYGVDINPESIDITKLSLFLKLASNERKLIGLSQNIKTGNSLVDDKTIDSHAFLWEDEFPEIISSLIENKGFDIVIGNPPYLNVKGLHESHEHITDFLKKNYSAATERYDFYVLFVEMASKLVKENGYLSFILPHKFINAKFGRGLRKYLADTKLLNRIISFGHNLVFDDSTTYTCILTLKNTTNDKFHFAEIESLKTNSIAGDLNSLTSKNIAEIKLKNLDEKPWILKSGITSKILSKINTNGKNIMEYFEMIMSGLQTGDNSIYVLTPIKDNGKNMILYSNKLEQEIELEKEMLKPLLTGEDVKRYNFIEKPPYYVIYPYVLNDGNQKPISEDVLQSKYPLTYQYLSQFKEELIDLRTRFKTNPKYWHALHRGRVLANFEHEKIATPEISLGCNMTLDLKKFLHLEVVYSLLKKDDCNENIRYFLGILNSKVMWFFLKNSGDVLRGGFFRFKTMYIEPFSIPPSPSDKIEKEIVSLVNQNLEFHKEFYEQHQTFLNLLKYNLKIEKFSKNLEVFYNLEFNDLLEELEKKYKIKISISDQTDWLNQFKLFKNKLIEIQTKIELCDDKINQIVYSLYGFNEEEIQVIEDNYPKQSIV
ncbi:Modification methylase BstVI protein [Marine Group I thaumarchaeote SCGC AAA799-B03]|uniref:site-specific DNA-methyltransferase (adenine-specific) n=1 Tax=Marine Group I thaumarchaeote SCGC AAA799-B03 TaxID=1502289 RepID=A0A087S6Y5_9ARCH|nr:Modification methylase BstVI protein [Marine Group I thaumarchaeote SCGC AAA799-B03]